MVEEDIVAKNYGATTLGQLTEDFQPFRKEATIQCIPLTSEVLQELGVEGDTLAIDVSWSDEPMLAQKGDFLTSGGYSISAHDMASTYVRQDQTNTMVPPLNVKTLEAFVSLNRQSGIPSSSAPKSSIS